MGSNAAPGTFKGRTVSNKRDGQNMRENDRAAPCTLKTGVY